MGDLPYICPQHPEALVRHEYDRIESSHVLNGVERFVISQRDTNHRYSCNECGCQLAEEPSDG